MTPNLQITHRFFAAIGCALLLLTGCQSTGKDGKPLTQAEIIQKREATIQMAKNGAKCIDEVRPQSKRRN